MAISSFVAFAISLQLLGFLSGANSMQEWSKQPEYQEVNPGGDVIIPCIIINKKGECRWERDGQPVGIHPGKYIWANPNESAAESGDCSLKILDANLEFDDGVWQCQVTPSSFQLRDSLISEGAEVVVRESPTNVVVQRVGDQGENSNQNIQVAAAGEDLELECISTGANPPAKLKWYMIKPDSTLEEIPNGHSQDNRRADNARTWSSISRLNLPISKDDNKGKIKCIAEHPALNEELTAETSLIIHYPPTVRVEKTSLENLEDKKDPATLRCLVDSNPNSTVVWKKEGMEGIFSTEFEIVFSPVTRHTAGTYTCTAENPLGMSKPAFVDVDVKYSPRIVSVGPSKIIKAKMYEKTTLSCNATGNPPPQYQWLQKLPTQEVLIRSYKKDFVIQNVTYDFQGEFVCKAVNIINGQKRPVQSNPIKVEVSGAPQVMQYHSQKSVMVSIGDEAVLEVPFCANPISNQSWHLGDDSETGTGNNIILTAGTGTGRFHAESIRTFRSDSNQKRDHCYISTLRIKGAHPSDSRTYKLLLTNAHGVDQHIIRLAVKEHVSQESLIAVAVGCVLTILLLILIIIYVVKANKCCGGCCSCCSDSEGYKDRNIHQKELFKPSDHDSEKTDLESTHSSNVSGYHSAEKQYNIQQHQSVIPPDALYTTNEKIIMTQNPSPHPYNNQQFGYEADFNDSKESLRPDLINSNLNRTISVSGELNTSRQLQCQSRISYNDLCFPKTSNYGSMKKKKSHHPNGNGYLGQSRLAQIQAANNELYNS